MISSEAAATGQPGRKEKIITDLKAVIKELSGQDQFGVDISASFFDLGFDSLFLTQASQAFRSKFGVKVTFRQLLEELSTIDAVASYLDQQMPLGKVEIAPASPPQLTSRPVFAPPPPPPRPTMVSPTPLSARPEPALAEAIPNGNPPEPIPAVDEGVLTSTVLERIMKQQLRVMSQQLDMLRGSHPGKFTLPLVPASTPSSAVGPAQPRKESNLPPAPITPTPAKAQPVKAESRFFGPYKPIDKSVSGGFTDRQQKHLDHLIQRYTKRTPESKRQTQQYRPRFADPRSVSGFRQYWKEMVYPIVARQSSGSKIWDIDGNEYVDVTMGFGTYLLGHSPKFITQAIQDQLQLGIEVGPQSPLAGRVAELMCELTGLERASFCNTGSEAVLAAVRLARTVTGRTRIATTSGFHGINDEVLVRASVVDGKRLPKPVAPGIPQHIVNEVLVLDYGTDESLELLRKHSHELAAVLIEPVQSRHPELQPIEFLREVRRITTETETALIFDEVITGFRCHPGGTQAMFGIKADIATYGKIIGGGLPIGAVAGSATYMDALDGGMWSYGDASFPEVGVTFFAGTYIRHPLAMAASLAILNYLKKSGPGLQQQLNDQTARFVATLNSWFEENQVPMRLTHFASLFYFAFQNEFKFSSLLFFHLREKGLHIWEGRPCFLSTAHTDADIEFIVHAFKASVLELRAGGFLPEPEIPGLRGVQRFEEPKAEPVKSISETSSTPASRVEVTATVKTEQTFHRVSAPGREMQFSLYYFGNYAAPFSEDKYKLVLEGAKFADQHGFTAVWLPERHFHAVGGFSPNPSVIAAALARETQHIQLRGGSVVLPLHHPVRVAEEWAVVDNLSKGRTGISIASGWHPNDFVFAPDAFEKRRELCMESVEIIKKLWRGESVRFRTGGESELDVRLYPMPMQKDLPIWLTCIHKESFVKAGEMGVGVLGYLMNQKVEEVAEKIALYRESLIKHGHDPKSGHVTILLHTFVDADTEKAREQARKPLCDYLRSFLDNSQKRIQSQGGQVDVDQEDMDYLLNRSFNDYVQGKALIGSPSSCAEVIDHLLEIGVDEVGCFIDFGIDNDTVLKNLKHLNELKARYQKGPEKQDAPSASPISPAVSAPQPQPGSPLAGVKSFPLTESQTGLWLLGSLDVEASRVYNESVTLVLRGPLDLEALRRAIQAVVDRHEALRTTFSPNGDFQQAAPSVDVEIPFLDFSNVNDNEREEEISDHLRAVERETFDSVRGPFLRTFVVKADSRTHLLLLTFHHLLGNGPAYWVFMEDLFAFYEEHLHGVRAQFRPAMQLSEFVQWREEFQNNPAMAESEAFWLKQFEGEVPVLELPLDHPRPSVITYRGARQILTLDREFCSALRKVGAAHRCSFFMTLFSSFNVLLHRLTGQDDLVVGVPFDSEIRTVEGGRDLFANTTNVMPLRSRIHENPTFVDYLNSVKRQVAEASEHQEYFFGKLVSKLHLPRGPSRSPLVAVTFNLESGEFRKNIHGLEVELDTRKFPYRNPAETAMFEMYVNAGDKNGELEIQCDHKTDLIDPETMQRWLGHWKTLLEAIASNPERRLNEFPLLNESQRRQVLVDWNDTEGDYPQDACVHQLFEEQASRTPNATAIVCGTKELTYRELNSRADELAAQLQRCGVGAETLVGLCIERSLEMVVGLLAILKAGGAYVPLDPSYPRERLAFILEDTRASVILTRKKLAHRLPQVTSLPDDQDCKSGKQNPLVVYLDAPTLRDTAAALSSDRAGARVTAQNLAYVLFTSGSTGRPKGVPVTHRSIVRLVKDNHYCSLTPDDVFLQLAPITFDASTFEIWASLLNGARLVIMPPNTPSLKELGEAIQRYQITTLWLTAGLFQLMVDEELSSLKSVRQLLAGGDVLSIPHIRKALGELTGCHIINGYGPTENTTFTCCHSISEQDLSRTSIPIGRPISRTRVYILDRSLQPVAIGVAGELYIGGDGLARGYLNRPELTAEAFVPNPFSDQPGDRLYRSGDLARYLPDGAIEFLGRLDEQVKIRGYRIEVGEIEAAMAQHPGVREGIVLVRKEIVGDKRLVAYVVPKLAATGTKNGSPSPLSLEGELRKFLQDKLPDYMVPAAFVILNDLPLTPNGKVNRAALPAPAAALPAVPKAYVAPRDSLELQLVKLWEKIFGIRPIGVRDNFFELGGHSLLAVRLFAQVARFTGKNLPLVTLFEAPTIEQLAKLLGQDGWTQPWSPLVPIKLTGSRPPFYCVHGVGGNIVEFTHLARYLEAEQPLYGIQAQGLDGKKPWLTRVEDMAALYIKEIRAFQPDGPYYLGGSSFGGLVAYEMAQQLHVQGERTALLVLFDTNAPSYPKYLPTTTAFRKALNELRLRVEVHWSNLKVIEPEHRGEYLRDKAYRLRRRIRNTMRQKYQRLCTIIQSFYLPRPIREVQKSGHEANRTYVPKPYPGHITLFRATEQPYGIYPDPALGWGELAIGGLEIVDIMGHHGAIIREPRVRALAQKLNESLRRAQVTNRTEQSELGAAAALSSLPTT